MRFVVYGAGAIGGVVGGRLAEAGHEVVLIARGEHHDAIRDDGLRLVVARRRPLTLSIPVVVAPGGHRLPRRRRRAPRDEEPAHRQARCSALRRGRAAVDLGGVRAERRRQRAAPRCGCSPTCTACAWCCPALHLEPGVVRGATRTDHRHPRRRALPARRRTTRGETIAAAFDGGDVRVGAARRHHAVEVREAAEQPRQRGRRRCAARADARGSCTERARDRGRGRASRAAGIDVASTRGGRRPARRRASSGRGRRRSRARRRRRGRAWPGAPASIEADYLNGEIVLLGRLARRPHPGEPAAATARRRRRPRGWPSRDAAGSTS